MSLANLGRGGDHLSERDVVIGVKAGGGVDGGGGGEEEEDGGEETTKRIEGRRMGGFGED